MTLTVSNLSVLRASRHLLSGVGFEVSAGQALILRGPNGFGKTTLLRTIAGLQPVHEGQVDMPEDMAVYAGHLDGIKSYTNRARKFGILGQRFWNRVH
jgi:heme exporter protein A